jgi:hypothetical protein
MKGYYTQSQLRLVGKAWEIRYYLRKLSADQSMVTVRELIDRRRTIRPMAKQKGQALKLIPQHN